MTRIKLLFCVSALTLLAAGSALAQRPTPRTDTIEIRQQCINEARSRFPTGGYNDTRSREMTYRDCMGRHGLRP